MTTELLLQAADAAPVVEAGDLLAGRRRLVVVAPHPDDETLGCGTLLHAAAAAGVDCSVVCMTDGSASHPHSRKWPAPLLAALRRQELAAAVARLGVRAEIVWMGYPDTGLPCSGPAFEQAVERLSVSLPRDALVAGTWAGDPHVDHVRSSAILDAVAAVRPDLATLAYPIWGRFADAPAPPDRIVRLASGDTGRAAKAAALACHASQMTHLIDDDPDGFVMPPEQQAHFLDAPEIFLAA